MAATAPVWRLWAAGRMTMTELKQASIDDIEDAWAVLEAYGDAEHREMLRERQETR